MVDRYHPTSIEDELLENGEGGLWIVQSML